MMKTGLFRDAFILLAIVGVLNLAADMLYLYEYIWWMDILVHFLAGACVGITVLMLYSFKKDVGTINKTKAILFAVSGALAVGILWEIYELTFGITTLADGIHYVTDTASDIIMDIVGGFLGVLYGFRYLKNNDGK